MVYIPTTSLLFYMCSLDFLDSLDVLDSLESGSVLGDTVLNRYVYPIPIPLPLLLLSPLSLSSLLRLPPLNLSPVCLDHRCWTIVAKPSLLDRRCWIPWVLWTGLRGLSGLLGLWTVIMLSVIKYRYVSPIPIPLPPLSLQSFPCLASLSPSTPSSPPLPLCPHCLDTLKLLGCDPWTAVFLSLIQFRYVDPLPPAPLGPKTLYDVRKL